MGVGERLCLFKIQCYVGSLLLSRKQLIARRCFNFEAAAMLTEKSHAFKNCIKGICGISGQSGSADSLQSSLPSELMFNDMRDAVRRHQHSEKASPAQLHSIAIKSASKRSSGCKPVMVQDSDWSAPIKEKQIKSSVWSALRQSDASLGIPTAALTRVKTNHLLTKPHHFTSRLILLDCLAKMWHESSLPDPEERQAEVLNSHRCMWISRLVGLHRLVRKKGGADDQVAMVIRAGPFTLQCLDLLKSAEGESFCLRNWEDRGSERPVLTLDVLEVSVAAPVILSHTVAWKATKWLTLPQHVAHCRILQVRAGLLSALCSKLGLKHGKLDHRHRVELFLLNQGCAREYVDSVLAQLPEKKPKAPNGEDPEAR